MNKYDPLYDFLRGFSGEECVLTFSKIEEIIGDDLLASARGNRRWWGNQVDPKRHSRAWMDAGWRVGPGGPNFSEETVRFIRA